MSAERVVLEVGRREPSSFVAWFVLTVVVCGAASFVAGWLASIAFVAMVLLGVLALVGRLLPQRSPAPQPELKRPNPDSRCSDADRERTVAALSRAAGDGRLDPEELEERTDAAFRARTFEDLDRVTVDLG